MSVVVKTPPRTIMEVYRSLPEGTLAELIDNVIYMSPPPLSNHQIISSDLLTDINYYLRKMDLAGPSVLQWMFTWMKPAMPYSPT